MAAKGKSPNEKEVEVLPPGTAAEEARLFAEVVGDRPTTDPPPWRIDDGHFRADLEKAARASPDDVDFARGVSENFKRIVEGLVEVASHRGDDTSEAAQARAFFLDEDTQDVKGSAQWLIDLDLPDQGLKGELLLYVSDMVFAAFDIAKHGSGSYGDVFQAAVIKQREKEKSALGASGAAARIRERQTQIDTRRAWLRPIAEQRRGAVHPKKISIENLAHELHGQILKQGWPEGINPVEPSTICTDLRKMFPKKARASRKR